MLYKEDKRDLFSVPEHYFLVHCISADFAMGAGIAVRFNEKFDMKNRISKAYPNYLKEEWNSPADDFTPHGDCLRIDNVFNLITKKRYWQKPTKASIKEALGALRLYCENENIKYLAMPKIGCGLDRLNWDYVSQTILDVFDDTDIEVLVCYL